MKSFFKKVALVLAMAMVVTMLPAKAASAAGDDLQMRKYMVLYLGGDATETYGEKANAWVKYDKETYTVAFTSSDGDVATVGPKKGGVTAVGVGRATVTATFTNKDTGETIAKECVVDVKKNAVSVALKVSQEKELEETGIEVGKTYQTAVSRLDADGNKTWRQVKVTDDKKTWVEGATTSGIRFSSDDETVFTVGQTKGLITAVGEGTANLSIWAVQSEKPETDEDGTKVYQRVTEIATYKVKVVDGEIKAEQSAWNAFKVTFPTEAEAKAAVDETAKSLTTSDAAVTENKEIIKVYEVIKNAAGEKVGEIAAFIGDVKVNGTVATVTMFDELKQETDYIIRYMNKEPITVTTIKNVAVSMDIVVSKHEKLSEDASQTVLDYSLYALGPNGQNIDITGCKDYADWKSSVELEDTNTNPYHAEYTFEKAAKTIWFYTADVNYAVTVKATFDDWFNIVDNKANTISAVKTITPGDNSERIGRILDYAVRPAWISNDENYKKDWAYETKAFAADDDGYFLIIKASLYDGGQEKTIYSLDPNYQDKFTFVSSNDDKLIIDKDRGELFPPKTPVNGEVGIHVYYDDQYIGTCNVTVYAKRAFTSFTAALSDNKLDYNSAVAGTPEDVAETIRVTLKPLDQLKEVYNKAGMSYDVEVYGSSTVQGYLNISPNVVGTDDDGYPYFEIDADSTLPTGKITSFRIVCTATYTELGNKVKEMKYSLTLTAKNTAGAEAKSYKVEATDSYDMIIDNDKNHVDSKYVTLKAYSYDKDGFKVKHLQLAAEDKASDAGVAVTDNTLVMQLGSEYVESIVATGSGDVAFVTVSVDAGKIEKIKEGSYVAYLYVGDGSKAVYKASKLISVKDSQPKVTWRWDKSSTEKPVSTSSDVTAVKEAIVDCITFKYGSNNAYGPDNVVDSDIYVEIGDYTLKGNKLTIDKVRYNLTIDGAIYVMEISVKRTITVGVTD